MQSLGIWCASLMGTTGTPICFDTYIPKLKEESFSISLVTITVNALPVSPISSYTIFWRPSINSFSSFGSSTILAASRCFIRGSTIKDNCFSSSCTSCSMNAASRLWSADIIQILILTKPSEVLITFYSDKSSLSMTFLTFSKFSKETASWSYDSSSNSNSLSWVSAMSSLKKLKYPYGSIAL